MPHESTHQAINFNDIITVENYTEQAPHEATYKFPVYFKVQERPGGELEQSGEGASGTFRFTCRYQFGRYNPQSEQYTEIIDISVDDAFNGLTNSVRLGNMILCASNISELKKTDEFYEGEKHKIASLEKICSDEGMEPVVFNLSEYMKSGAMLSCMVMHLNRVDHSKTLL